MQALEFSNYLSRLEQISSRIEMTKILAEFFALLAQNEVKPACYLLQGSLVPAYQSLDFQLSDKMVLRALARIVVEQSAPMDQTLDLFGQSNINQALILVTSIYKAKGDLGATAMEVIEKSTVRKASLGLIEFYTALQDIAFQAGQGSQERKLGDLVKLFNMVDPLTARYTVRIILGKMRLGFSIATMLDALSWLVNSDKSLSESLEQAYQNKADIGLLAEEYLLKVRLKTSVQELKAFLSNQPVTVGIPVMPALCQRLNSATEIIDKLGEVIAEPKYDGLRLQIHFQKSADQVLSITAFSRSLDDMTAMFPELQVLAQSLSCHSCILDSEAIGVDLVTGKLKAFQETITRKRKHEVGKRAEDVPIKFFIFDVLSLDGVSLIDQPLYVRRQKLSQILSNSVVAEMTQSIVTADFAQLHQFHERMLAEGLEGAVIKKADSQYRGGRKGWRWVKIKEAEGTHGKLSDTLDLLVMGYYLGKGKRTQFGLGAILVGTLDTTKEKILSISKIGTGMSEDQLTDLKQRFNKLSVKKQPLLYEAVDKSLIPDSWLEPELVVEVAADEITISPAHRAGVALRFPRLIKIRDDKSLYDITSLEELKRIRK